MNNYRISGIMPEVGATQIDIEAESLEDAINTVEENYGDFKVLGGSKI